MMHMVDISVSVVTSVTENITVYPGINYYVTLTHLLNIGACTNLFESLCCKNKY